MAQFSSEAAETCAAELPLIAARTVALRAAARSDQDGAVVWCSRIALHL
jgi:hypothetical protein